MINVKLTTNEVNFLIDLVHFGNLCSNGCYLDKMNKSKMDCDKCDLTKIKNNILRKMGGKND